MSIHADLEAEAVVGKSTLANDARNSVESKCVRR